MMSHSFLSAKPVSLVFPITTRDTPSRQESADGENRRPQATARGKDVRMNRCRGTMQSRRLINPQVLKAKSLGPMLRLKSRKQIASRLYARPRLAGKSEDLRRRQKGPLMQWMLQRLSLAVLPAVEANRLKLPTPAADALRRKPPKSKEELEEKLGQNLLGGPGHEAPIKSQEKDEPGEVPGRTQRALSIGRILTSAEWSDSSEPVGSAPTD